ncbi:10018_t:CDS:10 [Entrophospora sp. SA101]|nr:10018_t:CDS:10 [Entrophospora sp. SA101]
MAWMRLKESYRYNDILNQLIIPLNNFDLLLLFNSKFEVIINDDNTVPKFNDSKIKEVYEKYPAINQKIEKAVVINSKLWKTWKKRFLFCSFITMEIFNMPKNDNLELGSNSNFNNDQDSNDIPDSNEKLETNDNSNKKDNSDSNECKKIISEFFLKMLLDEEKDYSKLTKKYTDISQEKNFLSTVQSFISNIGSMFKRSSSNEDDSHTIQPVVIESHVIERNIQKATQMANEISDSKFVKQLNNSELFNMTQETGDRVISIFFGEYQNWRNVQCSSNIKDIIPKYADIKDQYEENLMKESLQDTKKIEEHEFKRICSILEEKFSKGLTFTYEIESIQPDQLNITLYETRLEESENSNIQKYELHVPKLHLDNDKNSHASFKIDPERYELRKISQFENGKFLIILRNKKSNQIEIFFENSNRLKSAFQLSNLKPLKTLNPDGDCLFAINEPKGLIGIYVAEKGLNVYAFDENQASLYSRNPNIQILQYYNNSAPDIKYFFFIKNTEELCFVETNGRAKIYNLITGQFRPATLPDSTNISSTPDGSCIVVFVKEKSTTSSSNDENGTDVDSDNECPEEQKHSKNKDLTPNDVFKAYVYFCSNMGNTANKVVELPSNMDSLEFFQFSTINDRQMHLTTIDVENNLFHSLITKITLQKTQYQFQQRNQKKPIGQIRLLKITSDNDKNKFSILKTNFNHNIKEGEYIVIKGQKLSVVDVISDTKLKVAGVYHTLSLDNDDAWVDFQTVPKTKLNGFIDAYKLMFEKYPIESCIDSEQNRPLNLKILKKKTKKPASILKHFKTTITTFSDLDIEENNFISKHSIKYQLGEWIIQLSYGLASNDYEVDFDVEHGHRFGGIAENISLGWYEGIFKHFGDRQVKVVSSMGEQSCGKSYMLNHLVGTTFDGSAMRCTEGVWMSLFITKKYIYVALDFEGLKSLERTPQEDLFLTLFNTMVSNMILFKNQFAVSRDMSGMFQRFQDGIVDEFRFKFDDLVRDQGEDNFITRMYKSGLTILPWPLFNDPAWFKNFENCQKNIGYSKSKI